MTFPHKEELVYFENLEKRQKRIFNDATDYGIPFSEVDRNEARGELKKLLEIFRSSEYDYKAENWGNDRIGGKEVKFFIPIEYDEGCEVGLKVLIGSTWGSHKINRSGDKGYFYVSIERGVR